MKLRSWFQLGLGLIGWSVLCSLIFVVIGFIGEGFELLGPLSCLPVYILFCGAIFAVLMSMTTYLSYLPLYLSLGSTRKEAWLGLHLMQLIPGPVHSIIGVRSGRIREAQANRSMRRVIDAESKHITPGIAGRKHLDLTAFILKAAAEHAVIHIQRLVNTLQRGSLKTLKTNDSQMEPVGIDTEIVRSTLAAGVFELAGIDLFVAVTEIKRLQILFRTVILRIGERMPAPVGHSPERHSLGIKLREALKTGHIGSKSKMAVAHS